MSAHGPVRPPVLPRRHPPVFLSISPSFRPSACLSADKPMPRHTEALREACVPRAGEGSRWEARLPLLAGAGSEIPCWFLRAVDHVMSPISPHPLPWEGSQVPSLVVPTAGCVGTPLSLSTCWRCVYTPSVCIADPFRALPRIAKLPSKGPAGEDRAQWLHSPRRA